MQNYLLKRQLIDAACETQSNALKHFLSRKIKDACVETGKFMGIMEALKMLESSEQSSMVIKGSDISMVLGRDNGRSSRVGPKHTTPDE